MTSQELFEACWIAYRRKGSKKAANAEWDRLTEEERNKVLPHIPHYNDSKDFKYRKDFERYLKYRVFECPVFDNDGNIIYDPDDVETADADTGELLGFQR